MECVTVASATGPTVEQQLYDRSVALFERHGFRGLSVDAICAGIGTSRATLDRSFGSPEELLALVVQTEVGQFLGTWHHIDDTGRLTVDLHRWAERVLRWQHRRGAARLYIEALAEAVTDRELREELARMHRELRERLARRLRRAAARGHLDGGVEVEPLAAAIARVVAAAPGDWVLRAPAPIAERVHEVQRVVTALVGRCPKGAR